MNDLWKSSLKIFVCKTVQFAAKIFLHFFYLYFQFKMDNKLCIFNLNNCADLHPYKAKFNLCDLTVVSGDFSELRRE